MNNLLKYITNEEFNYVYNENDLYNKSLFLVEILFKNRVDKCNVPYVTHLLRVSEKMGSKDGKVAALLHDVVEDIEGVTFDDLRDIGIPLNIIEVLKLVTKKPHDRVFTQDEKLMLYNEEINNIINSNNEIAIELKYSDMSDNFNEERLKLLEPQKRNWFLLKYGENIKKLEKAREKKNDRY